jgi:hypothetical protein
LKLLEMKLSLMCMFLNGLKYSDKNMSTLQMIKECMGTSIANVHELVAKD